MIIIYEIRISYLMIPNNQKRLIRTLHISREMSTEKLSLSEYSQETKNKTLQRSHK